MSRGKTGTGIGRWSTGSGAWYAAYSSALIIEAERSSETSVNIYQTLLVHTVEDSTEQAGNLGNLDLYLYLFHAGFFLGLFFDPEDGGDVFLRNVACRHHASSACYLLYASFLLHLLFDPEDGGDVFLWNVGWLPAVSTALYVCNHLQSCIVFRGSRFESHSGHRLSWPKFLCSSSVLSRTCRDSTNTSFQILSSCGSSIILPSDGVQDWYWRRSIQNTIIFSLLCESHKSYVPPYTSHKEFQGRKWFICLYIWRMELWNNR
jgi:hypothetical protein